MSGVLKHKKKMGFCCLILFAALFLILGMWYVSLFFAACIVLMYVNKMVIDKNMRAYKVALSPKREIRQWNTLVIGEFTPPHTGSGNNGNTLLITVPGRSLEASRQILLHTGSALTENGEVIILNKGKQRKNKTYTIFDIPYLGLVARKELGLERLERKARYPIIYEPLKSIRFLLGISLGKYVPETCLDEIIVNYCKRKGFKLTYLELS